MTMCIFCAIKVFFFCVLKRVIRSSVYTKLYADLRFGNSLENGHSIYFAVVNCCCGRVPTLEIIQDQKLNATLAVVSLILHYKLRINSNVKRF